MYMYEILLLWLTVACYVISSGLYIYGLVFKKQGSTKYATMIGLAGLLPHSVSLLLRWIESGHGPYITFYEITTSDAWVAVAAFLLFQYRYPRLKAVGTLVMPISFLLIGLGVMSSPEIYEAPTTFRTYWLIIHIVFGKLAFGPIIIATGLAVFYLLKTRSGGDLHKILTALPEPKLLDELSYKFMAFGFINLGIMIAAGSIWADYAWGRYWGWDPVETWALISWLVYGMYLHLRLKVGWKGKRLAWFALGAFLVLMFSIFGVVFFYHSVHSSYLK